MDPSPGAIASRSPRPASLPIGRRSRREPIALLFRPAPGSDASAGGYVPSLCRMGGGPGPAGAPLVFVAGYAGGGGRPSYRRPCSRWRRARSSDIGRGNRPTSSSPPALGASSRLPGGSRYFARSSAIEQQDPGQRRSSRPSITRDRRAGPQDRLPAAPLAGLPLQPAQLRAGPDPRCASCDYLFACAGDAARHASCTCIPGQGRRRRRRPGRRWPGEPSARRPLANACCSAVGLVATIAVVTMLVTRIARRALAEATGRSRLAGGAPSHAPGLGPDASPHPELHAPDWSPPCPELPPISPMDEHNTRRSSRTSTRRTGSEPGAVRDATTWSIDRRGLRRADHRRRSPRAWEPSVALVERHYLGGDCLNVGCVPSKGVIRASRMVAEARRAAEGAGAWQLADGAEPDFASGHGAHASHPRARSATRTPRSATATSWASRSSSARRASAESDTRARSASRPCASSKAVIATGSPRRRPADRGTREGRLPHQRDRSSTSPSGPRRLGVIGAGPIGCEPGPGVPPPGLGGDRAARRRAHPAPRRRRRGRRSWSTRFAEARASTWSSPDSKHRARREATATRARRPLPPSRRPQPTASPSTRSWWASGGQPNVEGLDLETVGVRYDARRGVHVNDYLQTTNPRIYAAGDICMELEVHPRGRCGRQDRGAERALLPHQEALLPGDALVPPTPTPRWRTSACTSARPRLQGTGGRHLPGAARTGEPRGHRRRGRGLRQDPHEAGHGRDRRRHDRRDPRRRDDQRDPRWPSSGSSASARSST